MSSSDQSHPSSLNPDDETVPSADELRHRQLVDEILHELFANHAQGQAVNLHLQNRAHISVETILQTSYRRMRQGLMKMDEENLRQFETDIRLGMRFLSKTMTRAVYRIVKQRRKTSRVEQPLVDEVYVPSSDGDLDLPEILAKVAGLRDLLTPDEFEILDLCDSMGLRYQEVHLRDHWSQVATVLEQHPEQFKLLENALLLGLGFQPRSPEFKRARQQALDGLERCGFPFDKAAENRFSRRYLKAQQHAQVILERFFPSLK
jgi:hypothetical protein